MLHLWWVSQNWSRLKIWYSFSPKSWPIHCWRRIFHISYLKLDDFINGEARKLQKELLQLDEESPTSWLEGWWDTMYLTIRDPLPINVCHFFHKCRHCAWTNFCFLGESILYFQRWSWKGVPSCKGSWSHQCRCEIPVLCQKWYRAFSYCTISSSSTYTFPI